jgi:hypothetical protein
MATQQATAPNMKQIDFFTVFSWSKDGSIGFRFHSPSVRTSKQREPMRSFSSAGRDLTLTVRLRF